MANDAPPVPKPSKAIGRQALGISVLALMCATFHVGPFVSLLASIYALVMIARQPEKHAGRGLAQAALALSLMGIAFVVVMGPTFSPSGDLRYRGPLIGGGGPGAGELEIHGIGALRSLIISEAAYAEDHNGAFATPGCLQEPATCTPKGPADKIYLEDWPGASVEQDWNFRFHPGAPSANGMIERYAVTAVRKSPGRNARNALCGDSRGLIVYSTDALEPRLQNELCDATAYPVI